MMMLDPWSPENIQGKPAFGGYWDRLVWKEREIRQGLLNLAGMWENADPRTLEGASSRKLEPSQARGGEKRTMVGQHIQWLAIGMVRVPKLDVKTSGPGRDIHWSYWIKLNWDKTLISLERWPHLAEIMLTLISWTRGREKEKTLAAEGVTLGKGDTKSSIARALWVCHFYKNINKMNSDKIGVLIFQKDWIQIRLEKWIAERGMGRIG